MVRADLINGAVSFLEDPAVATAPLEQRISFLRSKNLTQEEIDHALARVGQAPTAQAPPSQYQQAPPQYGNYSQQRYPQQWPEMQPEPPRRDWRDYFIAATVMGGVGYGLYWTAKRYVYPLIAPPTPPQLEQDKAAVDASFDKAFALLEQLATDTQELKDAETARKERLDSALAEVESAIAKMKQANDEREMEAKRMAREVSEIRDQIPNAIAKEKEATDNRLKDLHTEMKSLKTLVANRMQTGAAAAPSSTGRTTPSSYTPQSSGIPPVVNPVAGKTLDQEPPTSGTATNGSPSFTSANPPARGNAGTSYSRLVNGKNSIPSWQLAAKKKDEEAKAEGASSNASAESGTVSDAVDGGA